MMLLLPKVDDTVDDRGDWWMIVDLNMPCVLHIDVVCTLHHKSVFCCVRFSHGGKQIKLRCNGLQPVSADL